MTMNPQLITIEQFEGLIRDGTIQPGDLVLLENGERGILNRLIRNTQHRLLLDLDGSLCEEAVGAAAAYTHAGCVLDSRVFGEMYWPRARAVGWSDRFRLGMCLVVRRALDESAPYGYAPSALRWWVAGLCWDDIHAGVPYPFRELLYYWVVSWGWKKLLRRGRFLEIFRSRTADVCSGRYWFWCRCAGLFAAVSEGDARPEAWYPARLAITDLFATIGKYAIAAESREPSSLSAFTSASCSRGSAAVAYLNPERRYS